MERSFLNSHFIIDSYLQPFQRHRNQKIGDILVFFRECILCHLLSLQLDIECLI